jgi:putative transposase
MARALRIEYEGALYHITSRGNAKQPVYLSKEDYENFLEILETVVGQYDFILHAYCLMPNHYHLLMETPDANLSSGMRQLNGVYTQKFNREHERVGHLFQGRYKALLVEKESYLLELCRYIVLNPVRARIVEDPKAWPYSSYPQAAGFTKALPYLTTDWILSQFAATKKAATKYYREFVTEGVGLDSPLNNTKNQILLGKEDFIERLMPHLSEKQELSEIPRAQRNLTRPPLDGLLSLDKKTFGISEERDDEFYCAHVVHGYTLKEIADFIGVHYATVSRAVRRVRERTKV